MQVLCNKLSFPTIERGRRELFYDWGEEKGERTIKHIS